MATETTLKESTLENVTADPTFAQELVRDFLKLRNENIALRAQVVTAKRTEAAEQHALRQARGISTYLKSKQGELKKNESKTQIALRQAHGISSFLKSKNEDLEQRLLDAERVEAEAQQALRQARGFSAYLKSKNASLEKKLEAGKTERTAEKAFYQARQSTVNLRSSLLDETNGTITAADLTLDAIRPSPVLTDDDDSSEEAEGGLAASGTDEETLELSATHKFGMIGLVLIGIAMAMQ